MFGVACFPARGERFDFTTDGKAADDIAAVAKVLLLATESSVAKWRSSAPNPEQSTTKRRPASSVRRAFCRASPVRTRWKCSTSECASLKETHGLALVHRDIKPAGIRIGLRRGGMRGPRRRRRPRTEPRSSTFVAKVRQKPNFGAESVQIPPQTRRPTW